MLILIIPALLATFKESWNQQKVREEATPGDGKHEVSIPVVGKLTGS